MYPSLQVHKNEPSVSEQVALVWQSLTLVPFGPSVLSHSSLFVHVTPSPSNPSKHVQVKDPVVFTHCAAGLPKASTAQLCVPSEHSSKSVQLVPFPPNPALHWHSKDPTVSMQVAFRSQLSIPKSHSKMFAQEETPSPTKPVLQAQVKDPTVSVQVAFELQLFKSGSSHSRTSQHPLGSKGSSAKAADSLPPNKTPSP
eukprot:582929-Rhodomonas_salina.2